MSDINLKSLNMGSVTISPRLEDKRLVVALDGVCDSFAVKPLGGFLKNVVLEIQRVELTSVAIDMTGLRLLNSSCIKQLITFLRLLDAGALECSVVFVVDSEGSWQQRSVSVLARMCPTRVSIASGRDEGLGVHPCRAVPYAAPLSSPPGPN
jgi:hypothetical protein